MTTAGAASSGTAAGRGARVAGAVGAVAFFILASLFVTAVAAPGIAAIGAFRTLPSLGLELPDYATYADGSPAVMGRIAAGQVMHPVFDTAALAAVILAFAMLVAWIVVQASAAASWRRTSTRLANAAIVLACALAVGSLLCAGRLDRSLDDYLSLAKLGERERAESARALFDGHHRTAERLAGTELLTALAAIGLAAMALLPRRDGTT